MLKKRRSLTNAPKISDMTEANGTLHMIGILTRAIDAKESELTEKMALLRKETDARLSPLHAQLVQHVLTLELELYATTHRAEILPSDRKTVTLSS